MAPRAASGSSRRLRTASVATSSGSRSPRCISSFPWARSRSRSPLEMCGTPRALLSKWAWVPLPAPGPPNIRTNCGSVGIHSCPLHASYLCDLKLAGSEMRIEIGARVRTRDGREVGEVHRVLVDLEDNAVTGIVVLKGRLLSRDILVPLDFIDRADEHEVVLTLTAEELDQLPEFAFNEILAPPPVWTSATPFPDWSVYVPILQRKRLGQHHIDITPGTRVFATDGEVGTVDEVELDPVTGELDAFWVRAGTIFKHDMRVPA